jgi:(1->4)-alpha-D-glucan 1-alpha-D-glucosylmutase
MRVPSATYRLQLTKSQTFADAADLVAYLAELGVSDLYASPVFRARAGSEHGYDVVDHAHLNPELGGEEAFARLAAALRAYDLGLLLDIVPNHMCIAGDSNQRWLDVLENGPSSRDARFFDIDWRPPKAELVGRVLLPVLSKQFGKALEEDLRISYESGKFLLTSDWIRLPLDPTTWSQVLGPALGHLRAEHGDEVPFVLELESIIRALRHLPTRTDVEPARVRERAHEREVIRRRLVALIEERAEVGRALDEALREINGRRGDPSSYERLEALLGAQGYRLSLWRVAAHEINYRRFFDINELAAIRVEDEKVFEAVHELPLRLVQQGIVSGFRIDHVDGLLDPEQYLAQLRAAWRDAHGGGETGEGDGYVVVEKILMPGERLSGAWATAGTTGYEMLNLISSVLVDGAAGERLKGIFDDFVDEPRRYQDIVYDGKKLILRAAMSAELTVLARKLDRISEQHRYTRDFTLNSLHEVLSETIACFPVYRTYIRPDEGFVADHDRAVIETAIRTAKRRNPVIDESVFDFVRALLLLDNPPGLSDSQREARADFVKRFQQLTGPVTAKGVEDTAFYRYFPLAALCEVGGDPSRFGVSGEEFHRRNAERMRSFPHALSATATHDTKRGEDMRARLLVLSELPDEWESFVRAWRDGSRALRTGHGGGEGPDPRDELLLYQTLVGSLPDASEGGAAAPGYKDRILAYMVKAIHEAKIHTSWVNPDTAYMRLVRQFVEGVLDPARSGPALQALEAFVARIKRPGYWNGLSQALLKIGMPGVPDIYQGTELWDFSLVDPDNRRPVDWGARRRLLAGLQVHPERPVGPLLAELMAEAEDGRIKLFVTSRALGYRRANAALFREGRYEPLGATGAQRDHVLAFARVNSHRAVLVVVGRHYARLGEPAAAPVGATWRDTRLALPEGLLGGRSLRTVRNVLTGATIDLQRDGTLALSDVCADLPVALVEVTAG